MWSFDTLTSMVSEAIGSPQSGFALITMEVHIPESLISKDQNLAGSLEDVHEH